MNASDSFLKEKITHIFKTSSQVVDLYGGLRSDPKRAHMYDGKRSWATPLITESNYIVVDTKAESGPDIVASIYELPFEADSVEAILCMSVLEHTEDPLRAVEEIYRVLRPGGQLVVYVPFLFCYHAHTPYFKDYWRFTQDSLELLFRKFGTVEVRKVRGATETWVYLSPLGKIGIFRALARVVDRVTGKTDSNQVSGFNVFLVK